MQQNTVTCLSLETIASLRSWLNDRGRSEATIKAYSTDLRMLLEHVGVESIPISQVEQVSRQWLQTMRKMVAPKTTHRRLTSLKTFAAWAGMDCDYSDYSAPRRPPMKPHPLPEGANGVMRLIEVASRPKHAALVAACGLVGARIAEALAMRPSDIDFANNEVKILGKGEKVRMVPISPTAWDVLAAPTTAAFVEGDRCIVGLQDRFARQIITDLGAKAKLKRPISSHDLRATFATEVYYNSGGDIRLVQELLGHSSIETTMIYIGVDEVKRHHGVDFVQSLG